MAPSAPPKRIRDIVARRKRAEGGLARFQALEEEQQTGAPLPAFSQGNPLPFDLPPGMIGGTGSRARREAIQQGMAEAIDMIRGGLPYNRVEVRWVD